MATKMAKKKMMMQVQKCAMNGEVIMECRMAKFLQSCGRAEGVAPSDRAAALASC
jgi:hypothetical protein